MAERLRPEGTALVLGDVVLYTPGLDGMAETHEAGTAGMRGAEGTTAGLLEALARTSVDEQLTVEISDPVELDDVGGSRAAGGAGDIVAEVPGPGTGLGQVVLYAAEDGTMSWHLPVDIGTNPVSVSTRGGDRRTYRIPRSVAPPAQLETGDRGVLGAIGSKLLKVLVFPLIDPILGQVGDFFASRWEGRYRPYSLRSFASGDYRTKGAALKTDTWTQLAAGPSLLFVHGTASQSHTGFGRIPEPLFAELAGRYENRVFAFDHFTISANPSENVRWLADQLPDDAGLTVDVIAHSRGGLVARAMAERGEELGLGGKLSVRTLIMVGTPNAGTALADRAHLGALLDRFTTLVQLIPDNPVTDTLEVVITIIKQLAVGAMGGLDGLLSMDPRGAYLRDFLNQPSATATTYRAVASNFEPATGSPLLRIARDGATDFVFGSDHNDLVVPTEGVFKIAGLDRFAPVEPLIFTAADGVDHSSYWDRPAFAGAVLRWLPSPAVAANGGAAGAAPDDTGDGSGDRGWGSGVGFGVGFDPGAVAEPGPEATPPPAPPPPPANPPPPGAPPPPPPDGAAGAPVPRVAYPRIDAPPAVVVEETFDVIIGVASRRDKTLSGTGGISLTGPVDIDLLLTYDPESLSVADEPPRILHVTEEVPYPAVTLKVTARYGEDLSPERRIGAHFLINGEVRGIAWRDVLAVDSVAELATAQPRTSREPQLLDLHTLLADEPPDLVLAVYRADVAQRDVFVWSAFPRSSAIATPAAARPDADFGDAKTFATTARRTVSTAGNAGALYYWLVGTGKAIGRAVPDPIQDVIRAVAAEVGGTRAATALLLTEEVHVPWELAVLNPPLSTDHAPGSPFLGAHVAIGRWLLTDGRPRPAMRQAVAVREAVVLTAEYAGVTRWPSLPNAVREANELVESYPGTHLVAPLFDDVMACLGGDPPADLLHFALHGQFDPDGTDQGLVLLAAKPDGTGFAPEYLQAQHVDSATLSRAPFVFLNACQVGALNEVLGDYAGLAVSFLRAGASGVLAPIWNVDDAVASAIAKEFYSSAYGESPLAVAEIVRRIRARYTESGARTSEGVKATLVGYQVFGHPWLQLQRDPVVVH